MAGFTELLGLASSAVLGPALPGCHDGGRPIVVLPGFACPSRFLIQVEDHLRQTLLRPVLRLELGSSFRDLRSTARRVLDEIEALELGSERIDVVGHSMGGLVATYALKRLDRGARLQRVVTLGTPHRGAPVALLGVLLSVGLGASLRQLVPGSPFLRSLAAQPVPPGCELVAVTGGDDRVVPAPYARIRKATRARCLDLPDETHASLLTSARALESVVHLLGSPLPEAGPTHAASLAETRRRAA